MGSRTENHCKYYGDEYQARDVHIKLGGKREFLGSTDDKSHCQALDTHPDNQELEPEHVRLFCEKMFRKCDIFIEAEKK